MKNLEKSSIYPYLIAEFIEAEKDGWTIDAIRAMTHENLKQLKDDHKKRREEEKIVHEAQLKEQQIFESLPDLWNNEWHLSMILTVEVKKNIVPIIASILFLYEHRMGKDEAKRLRSIFNSDKNEPFSLNIIYKKDTNGSYYIKKIFLKEIKQ